MSKQALHTDREILQCIFDMYLPSYPGPDNKSGQAENDPYLPIDLRAVAARLACSAELLFGRLYYSLDRKHGYATDGGARVHLFAPLVGSKRHCVNFPFLAAILSEQRQENWKYNWTLWVAISAAALSVVSIVVQILTAR